MKRILVALLAVMMLVPTLWANQGVKGKTIKIGSFMPLSGPLGFIGGGVRQGMEGFIKWYNADVKHGGFKIKGFFIDDKFEAAQSVAAVKDLVENKKVFALVGAIGSPGILASMEYIKRKGLPFVYQGSGVRQLYNPPKRNVFPVQPSYVGEGRLFIKFAAQFLKKKKIAFVYQNDAGVSEASEGVLKGMKSVLRKYRRKGVKIVGRIPMSRGDADLSPVANRIKQLKPDAVVVFAFGGAAVGVIKAAREAGINLKKIPFMTTYVNSDPIYFKLAGNLWNDVYVGAWAKPDTGKYFKGFMRSWKKYSGTRRDPSPYNVAGWIAMETFAEGLKRTFKRFGSLTWNNYIKAMETFHEKGGWSGGMAYKLSYKKFNKRDKSCRYPQNYEYFLVGKKKQYELYKNAKSLRALYMPAFARGERIQ